MPTRTTKTKKITIDSHMVRVKIDKATEDFLKAKNEKGPLTVKWLDPDDRYPDGHWLIVGHLPIEIKTFDGDATYVYRYVRRE